MNAMECERIKEPALGDAIVAARLDARLSAIQVCEMTGILPANLSRTEHNERTLKWPLIYKLIVGCRLGLEFFFPEELILESAERILDRRDRSLI